MGKDGSISFSASNLSYRLLAFFKKGEMNMRKLFCLLICLGMLTIGSTAIAGDNDGDLTNLRYEYGKIRGTFTLYNNSGKNITHAKVQVSLHDNNGKIIGSVSRWFMNIPSGEFGSVSDFFWEGTTQHDFNRIDKYKWRITYLK